MTKLKNFAVIGMILLGLYACTDTDTFWAEVDGNTDSLSVCNNALASMNAAKLAFEQASEEEYADRCNVYKISIINYMNYCSDTSSVYQNILNELGDCSILSDSLTCEQATAISDSLGTVYENTDSGADDYMQKCQAYVQSLLNKIEACGDENGEIQSLINSLDCSDDSTETSGNIQFIISEVEYNFNQNIEVVENVADSLITITADEEDFVGYSISVTLPMNDLGEDIVEALSLTTSSSVYHNWDDAVDPHNPFTSNITTNSGSHVEGTFRGALINNNDDVFETESGTIDISY